MQRPSQMSLPGPPGDAAAPALTAWEQSALDAIVQAAELGLRAPTGEDLAEACGCSLSTTVSLVQRLEARGLLKVESYQRSRRITIVSTGKATAPVRNTTPRWRTVPRPTTLPTVPLEKVRDRKPDFARDIMTAARAERMEMQEFLAELVWTGWQARQAAIQGEGEQG